MPQLIQGMMGEDPGLQQQQQQPLEPEKTYPQRMQFVRDMLSNFMFSFGRGLEMRRPGSGNAALGAAIMGPFELQLQKQNLAMQKKKMDLDNAQIARTMSMIQQAGQSLQQKEVEFQTKFEPIPVVGPDGKEYTIPRINLAEFLQTGFKLKSAETIAAGRNETAETVANINQAGQTARANAGQNRMDARQALELALRRDEGRLNRDQRAALAREGMATSMDRAKMFVNKLQAVDINRPGMPTALGTFDPGTGKYDIQMEGASRITKAPIPTPINQTITSLDTSIVVAEDLRKALAELDIAMGPVSGRKARLLSDWLGGKGLTPDQMKIIAKLDINTKLNAFQEAGKQLSGTEAPVVFRTIPKESETLELALKRIDEGLPSMRQRLQSTISQLSGDQQENLFQQNPRVWNAYATPAMKRKKAELMRRR